MADEDLIARCISQFRHDNYGEISKSLFNNFNITPSQQLEKSRSQIFKERLMKIKNKNQQEGTKSTFITGVNLEFERAEAEAKTEEVSYDDMIKNIDGLRTGFLDGYDDLELLRRRIERCEKGIREHAKSTQQLEREIKELKRGKTSSSLNRNSSISSMNNKIAVRAAHQILAKRY